MVFALPIASASIPYRANEASSITAVRERGDERTDAGNRRGAKSSTGTRDSGSKVLNRVLIVTSLQMLSNETATTTSDKDSEVRISCVRRALIL